MDAKTVAAFVTGIVFMFLLLGIGCFIAFRTKAEPVPNQAMLIFRVILALAASGFAAVLAGFLEIDGKVLGWGLKAGGPLAVFAAIYLINPPDVIQKRLPKPKKPRMVSVPKERIG